MLSVTACLLLDVEDTSTAGTRVIGIFEIVQKKGNEAASKQQPVRHKSHISLCPLNMCMSEDVVGNRLTRFMSVCFSPA